MSATSPPLTVRGLAVASHAGPTAVVTLLAALLSAGLDSGATTTVLVTLAVLAGQLSVGWSNDWLDAPRDLAVHRLDKPVVTGAVAPSTLRTAAFTALAVCAVASLLTGWAPGTVHLIAVASAWSYNLRLKSTAWSWAPYTVSFGLLAVFVVLAAPGPRLPAPWAVLAAALLGAGAHVANTLPDLEADVATGIRGLPHRLGRRRASVLAPALLVTATTVAVTGPAGTPNALALVGGGVAVALAACAGIVGATRPASRAPFALSMAVAGVCVVVLVLAAGDVAA